jgi:DNA-binding LytR/AlgR family response regulator
MEKVKVVLLDDEPLAIDVLESHISKFPHMQVVGKFRNVNDATTFIESNPVDVLFLDIQMPQITGLEFAKTLEGKGLAIVFVTAYPEYAVDAFSLEALDYMVKPVSLDRFKKSVERLEEFFKLHQSYDDSNVKMEEGHIFVKSDSKYVRLAYDDIVYVEAFADYVKIYSHDDKRVITLQTMKNMENALPSDKFIRVHRSYIVSLSKIVSLSGTEVTVGNKTIPIGKNYKDAFMAVMNQNNFLK